jgi:hypothetical protein
MILDLLFGRNFFLRFAGKAGSLGTTLAGYFA